MGLTPHRRAQAASERSRSGLSPAATNRAAALSMPTPYSDEQAGAVWVEQLGEQLVDFLASPRRARAPAGPAPAAPSWWRSMTGSLPGPGAHGRRLLGDQPTRNTLQGLADLLRGGEAEMADLVDRRDLRDPEPSAWPPSTPGSPPRCRPWSWPPPADAGPARPGPPRWRPRHRSCPYVGVPDGWGGPPPTPPLPTPRRYRARRRPIRAGAFHPHPARPARTRPSTPTAARCRPHWSGTTPPPAGHRCRPARRPRSHPGECPRHQ